MTSRFQQNLGEEHWTAVKNILKYFHNTKDMFLVYGDTEYIAAFDASKEAVWIRKFISGLGIVPTIELISMYCDNTRAIAIAKDGGVTKGAKYFRAKVHYLRETIKLGDVNIEKIHIDNNLADPFIKALAFPKHSELTRNIGLLPASSFIYRALMNELVNDGIKLSKLEINTGFINGLPKKWLSFCQSLRNTNHVKDYEVASLFDSPDDEEYTRSSQEYLNDIEEEYQERAILAKSKRVFKKDSQRSSGAKATDETQCHKYGRNAKYNKVKAKLAHLSCGASSPKSSMIKNKGLVAEAYEWYEEDVSSDDNKMTDVKVLMAADDENVAVCKKSAKNGKWVKITTKKVHTLLDMEDNDERKSFIDYLYIDCNYVEEQRNNLVFKHIDIIQELNTFKA
nr:hypothetical protein [Tanacetum cinerariifolium]